MTLKKSWYPTLGGSLGVKKIQSNKVLFGVLCEMNFFHTIITLIFNMHIFKSPSIEL
jgi:hypothetical protein